MKTSQGYLILPIVFHVLTCFPALCQSPSYIHYTTFDGLPSQVVYSVCQDNKGFIWFGTQNGLCRFDGTNFKTYTTDDGMPDNEVLQISEDKEGRLWLSLFNGGACYFKNEKFYWAGNDSSLAEITGIGNFVSYFFPDNENGFYIYGGHRLFYLSYDLRIRKITDDFFFGRAAAFCSPGDPAIFSDFIVSRLKGGTVIQSYDLNDLKKKFDIPYLTRFMNRKLFLNHRESKELEIIFFDSSYKITSVHTSEFEYALENIFDLDDYTYMTTSSHVLLRYHKNDVSFTRPEIFLRGKTFGRIIKDKENGLWITSIDAGIYYIPTEKAKIISTEAGLYDEGIYSISEFNNQIYFSDSKGNVYSYNPFKKIISLFDGTTVCRVLKSVSDAKYQYFGTDRGLFMFEQRKGNPGNFVSKMAVKDLILKDSSFYIASNGGVYYLKTVSSVPDTIITGRKTAICIDHSSGIWYGDLNGLYCIKPEGEIIDYGNKNKLLRTRITGISLSVQNIIWVATQAHGLIGMYNDSVYFSIAKQDGLSTNNLKSIYVTENIVCIATDKGVDLVKYNSDNLSFSIAHKDKIDGLADNDVNCVYLKNDTLYAGTAHGFCIVPLNENRPKIPPFIYITGLTVNNRDTMFNNDFELSYNKNYLVINYIAPSYASAGKIKYRYCLSEKNEWVYTTNTQVSLPDMQPGNYRFEVQAENRAGIWSDKPAVISFSIKPPFWQKLSFLIFIIFVVIFIITAIYYYRIRRFKKEIELENKMLLSEIKALRSQMNPHFIFNSLNSIQNFIFNNKKEDANEYLSQFSKLMRMILDNSQSNFVTVQDEVEFLKVYLKLEQLRLNNKFNFRIRFSSEEKINRLLIPSMILQPFAENAILHGFSQNKNDGQLNIDFMTNNGDLKVMITDNGIGIKLALQSKKSSKYAETGTHGLSTTTERIDAINRINNQIISYSIKDLSDVDNINKGTIVELIFKNVSVN